MRAKLRPRPREHTEPGSIGDILTAGIFAIVIAVVMVSFLRCVSLIHHRSAVSQLAREYLLRMETVGCLTQRDAEELTAELQALGVSEVDYGATTLSPAGYGQRITLEIEGTLEEHYAIRELRTSTAKH